MQFSDVSAGVAGENQPYYLPRVEEEVEISDNMAVISVPPPRFRSGDPAYILHDFHRVRTGHARITYSTPPDTHTHRSISIPQLTSFSLALSLPHKSRRGNVLRSNRAVCVLVPWRRS